MPAASRCPGRRWSRGGGRSALLRAPLVSRRRRSGLRSGGWAGSPGPRARWCGRSAVRPGRRDSSKLVHADRLAGPSDVIDEGPGVRGGYLRDPVERAGENGARFLAGDIPAGEHECPYLRGLQSEALKLAVADTFVAGQHDPPVPAGFGEPDFVRGALGKMIGETLNGRPRFTQGVYDRKAVERLVDKERDRFRRL